MPGVDAWVYSQPCENQAAGGDVHYVSTCAAGQVVRMVVADVAGHGAGVAETGAHLWAENFDGTIEDIFDFQDDITGVIAARSGAPTQSMIASRSF